MARAHKPMPYGPAFQESIIRLMMEDYVFCSLAVDQLKPTDFSNELSWFFQTIVDGFNNQCPTKEGLTADIAKHKVERQIQYTNTLERICAANVDADRIAKEMTKFIQCNIFIDSYYEAANYYNGNEATKAFEIVTEGILKLNRVEFGRDNNKRMESAEAVANALSFERKNAVRTGIAAIDEAMGGGLLPGTWTTFLGSSNAGKSMLMPNLAREAALQGKRTFVTIHEDEPSPTEGRYLACFSGVPYNRIAYGFASLTQEEKDRLNKSADMIKEFVVFRFMYTKESTVERVQDQSRLLMVKWPFHLYLCDYGQCLTSSDFKKLDSVRHLQEHVHHLLKQMCLELNIPGAGGAQVNRDGNKISRNGNEWLRKEDVAEAFGIVKKSSNVITINRSSEDIKNNRVVFLLDKSRNGKTDVAVECISDFSTSTVYSTGPGAQRDVSSEIGNGPKNRDGAPKDDIAVMDRAIANKNKVQHYNG